MRKQLQTIACIGLSLVMLAGCAGTQSSLNISEENKTAPMIQDAAFVPDEEGLYSTSEVQLVKWAETFPELVSGSDLIVKIRVQRARSFFTEYGLMESEITPEVLEIYKGSLEGGKLYVESGEMPYEEYINNEIVKKRVAGHEAPPEEEAKLKGTIQKSSLGGEYIMHPGEEYIFFAYDRGEGSFFPTYAYQGLFKVVAGKVENNALNNEPLRDDLARIFNAVKISSDKMTSRYKLVINEDSFEKKIKELC